MASPAPAPIEPDPVRGGAAALPPGALDFEALYDAHADFVWRSVRRLGVHPPATEDVVQEVFLVVHRRLDDFEGRSSLKTWLFGIALGIVRNHRRSQRRKRLESGEAAEAALLEAPADRGAEPDRLTERAEAARLLDRLLDELDDDRREVFVMAELEQMRGTEIAAATGLNLNTVYSRLRSARKRFNRAVARHRTARSPS